MTILWRPSVHRSKREVPMNPIQRRNILLGALALTRLPTAFGQPTGKILVGYPAGGTLDLTARRVADDWRRPGKTFVVDNKAGAAGRIASAQLKREPADGSVVLCTHTSALTVY